MFLGYSETDENLLKPHNNLSVVDAVAKLDSFMRDEVNNQVYTWYIIYIYLFDRFYYFIVYAFWLSCYFTLYLLFFFFFFQTGCFLLLYNLTKENVIVVARLITDDISISGNLSDAQNLQHLMQIKVSIIFHIFLSLCLFNFFIV